LQNLDNRLGSALAFFVVGLPVQTEGLANLDLQITVERMNDNFSNREEKV